VSKAESARESGETNQDAKKGGKTHAVVLKKPSACATPITDAFAQFFQMPNKKNGWQQCTCTR
jgi:hypothetical protein